MHPYLEVFLSGLQLGKKRSVEIQMLSSLASPKQMRESHF